jgi:hypothetical protein
MKIKELLAKTSLTSIGREIGLDVQMVDQTRRQYNLDLTVDTTLEDHATASQKERGIDILEFLQDSL